MKTLHLHSVVALLLIASPALAQGLAGTTAGTDRAEITTGGSAEVTLPATRASFSIGITTSRSSARAAGEENARLAAAVSMALQSAHLDAKDIRGTSFLVNPRWEDDENHRSKRTTFEATKTIRVETEKLADLGAYIDAALSAGATDVSEIEYSAKDSESARRRALAQAVASAREDAEAMAHAVGGTLGEPLSLTTEPAGPPIVPRVAMMAARAQPPGTEILPGEIRVTAQVSARWRLLRPTPAR